MTVQVSPVGPADADHIATWLTSRADVTMFGGPSLPFPMSGQDLLTTSKDGWVILAMFQGDVLFATGSYLELPSGDVRIGRLIVDPGKRGQGLGRLAVTSLVQHATEAYPQGTVTLGVFEQNVNARCLYESIGFRDTGAQRSVDVNGETWASIEMEKPPTPPAGH